MYESAALEIHAKTNDAANRSALWKACLEFTFSAESIKIRAPRPGKRKMKRPKYNCSHVIGKNWAKSPWTKTFDSKTKRV